MRSTDNGTNWATEQLVSSFYTTASMPSIATSYNGWVDMSVGGEMPQKTYYTNVVYVCFLEYNSSQQTYEIVLKYKAADDPDDGSWTEIDRIQAPSDCTPVLASPMPDETALFYGETSSCVLVWNDQSELKYSIYVNPQDDSYDYQALQRDVTGQGQIETYRARTLATGRLVQGTPIPPKYPSISPKSFRDYDRDLFVTWNESGVQKMISLGYDFQGQASQFTTVTVGTPLTVTPPSSAQRIANYASPSIATHAADPVFVYEREYPIVTAPVPRPYPIATTLAYTPYTYGTKSYYAVTSPYPTIPWFGVTPQIYDWRYVYGCKMQYYSGRYSLPRWWTFQRRMSASVSRLNPTIAAKAAYHTSDDLVMAMNESQSSWLSADIDASSVTTANIVQRDGLDPATNYSGDVVACNASLTASSPYTHRINSYGLQKATVTSQPVMKQVYVATADSAFAKYGIVMPHVRNNDNELTEIEWAAEPDTAVAEPYSIEDMARTEPFSVSDGYEFEYATDMYAFHPEEFVQEFAYEMKFYDSTSDSLLLTDRIQLSDLPSDSSMYVVYRIDISELAGRTVYMAMGLDDTTSTMVSNLVRVVLLDDLSTEKAVSEKEPLPTDVTLYQNYPNPFNPTTAISFYLPTGMNFALEVFNNLGMKTRVLESGWRDAGAHTVQFDATGLPSGVYYYKLTAGDRVLTKRMALVK